MEKILSVIVPTYNMEKYLDKCLSSLLVADAEMLKLLEVLVIIDGATDRSSTIAHLYQARYPNVFVVVDKENGNYGSCINVGVQLANGKYVKVLDADDDFNTNNLADYIRFLNGVNVDMVVTPYAVVDETGCEKSLEKYDLASYTMLTWKQLTPAFKKKALQMHAVTYKLQKIKDVRYVQTEGISYTDQEWIFTPLTTVKTAIAYPNVIYKYLVGRDGQTINPEIFKRNISHNEQCCKRIINDYNLFGKLEASLQEYLDYKFLITLTSMYEWYLLRYSDLDISVLMKFDEYVKSKNALYMDLLDRQTIKYTHYRYIRMWHNCPQRRSLLSKWLYFYSILLDKFYRRYES